MFVIKNSLFSIRKPLKLAAFVLILLTSYTEVNAQRKHQQYDLSHYEAQDGLIATVAHDTLVVTWNGEAKEQVQLQFIIRDSIPTIAKLSIKKMDGPWLTLATNLTPEFKVVSGLRRVTQQQTEPLEKLEIPLTEEKLNEIKWDAFWDAPLYIEDEPPKSHGSSIPAAEPFANHPGMPRKPDEVIRAFAKFKTSECIVRTNGARLEITFPGVKAGIFTGNLQFDVFKGTNLFRQMIIAKTDQPSAAFKYNAGLNGLPLTNSSRLMWRDLAKNWQDHHLGTPVNKEPVIIKSSNRLIAAELADGAIAVFPPPHSFYWARESEQNLGYSWYRKDSDQTFSFGMRQAEHEEDPEFYHNFALYSARPGTWQRMPVFFYVTADAGRQAISKALEFTHDDTFKPLPGYKVMGHHYHVGLVKRLKELGSFDQKINDIATMKSIGVDIFSIIDGVRGPARHDRGEAFVDALAEYYEAAQYQSDKDFLVIPNDENSTGGRPPFMGGHYDILIPGPVFWRPQRNPGEPLFNEHPKYGRVYNLGTPSDMMEMTEHENVLISMPHPNTKRATGYPEAIKDAPHFLHENYFALGYRWGMGIDASEKRLGEYRFLNLWDKTNNWMAQSNLPPKFALAISEARSDKGYRGKPPYDDAYGMSPVNYLKIDSIPSFEDMQSIIRALKKGEFFITTGEVLIPHYEVTGEGNHRKVVAELEWTFPLDFIEIVWGDGKKTDRKIISTTDLLPFSKKRFEIPFEVGDKKWIRFAAWDVATNGALTQPVNLQKK